MNNKTVVIYHRADFDGLFCREIAKKFLGSEGVEYIGWDYGDTKLVFPPGDTDVYVLDLSPECFEEIPQHTAHLRHLVWIDHHKSAIEKFSPAILGYRIDGVAACRLAWQWFYLKGEIPIDYQWKTPYFERKVSEPLAVRLAGEYDIWDKRDPRADLFQHGLRSRDIGENLWELLLTPEMTDGIGKQDVGQIAVDALLEAGEVIEYVQTQQNASIIQAYGFTVQFEGLTFLACNHARFNSHLFTAGVQVWHDALMGFNFDGSKGHWRFSLYHAPGHEQHDLSAIAKKYGGGGHKGACGFRVQDLSAVIPQRT